MNRAYETSATYPGIPTPSAIELPILQHVADGRTYGFGSIYAAMVAHFNLSPKQEEEMFPYARGTNPTPPSGKNVFYKYCNNACDLLIDRGWLVGGEGRYYEDREYAITPLGLKQVTSEGESL